MTPECNITLENVWRYIALYPDGSIHYEEAGIILGTLDDRTIRKHILLGYRMIEKANLSLTEFLSIIPAYAQVPELKAGESAYGYLSLLIEEANRAVVRMGVSRYEPTPPVIYVHIVYENAVHVLVFVVKPVQDFGIVDSLAFHKPYKNDYLVY